jgi:hypothetical protein
MACNNIETISFNCQDSAIGGIEKLYLIDQNDVISASFSGTHSVQLTIATSSTVQEIEFRRHVGNYTEDYAKVDDGSIVYTQTINLPIHGRDAGRSAKIQILAQGQRYLAMIVKMTSGKYVYFSNMQLQTIGEGSGTVKTDANKYSLSFVGINENLAYFMDEASVLAIL